MNPYGEPADVERPGRAALVPAVEPLLHSETQVTPASALAAWDSGPAQVPW